MTSQRHLELAAAAEKKLQILVEILLQPFPDSRLEPAYREWQEAEHDLKQFRDHLINTQLGVSGGTKKTT